MEKQPQGKRSPLSNAAVYWDGFNSRDYFKTNYAILRPDDAAMLRRVVEWLMGLGLGSASAGKPRFSHGLDAGSGTNLAPALIMVALGFEKITLFEFSARNVEFLRRHIANLPDSWKPFWDIIAPLAGGRDFEWARRRLREITEVVQGNILTDLPVGEYGFGTMFFVAESLSGLQEEVQEALHNFVRSLIPGSPFIVALMEGSREYRVGNMVIPATPVYGSDVSAMLDPVARALVVEHFDIDGPSVHVDDEGNPQVDFAGYLLAMGLSALPN